MSAPGFSGYQQTGIVLVLNQHATLDVALHPGSVQEQVVVNADVVELDQTSSALSSEVTGTQISSLPLNTRESYALLDLVPGFYGSIGNDYNNVSYSINGGDYDYGDILVDGTPAGFPTVNGVQGVGYLPIGGRDRRISSAGAGLSGGIWAHAGRYCERGIQVGHKPLPRYRV